MRQFETMDTLEIHIFEQLNIIIEFSKAQEEQGQEEEDHRPLQGQERRHQAAVMAHDHGVPGMASDTAASSDQRFRSP